MQTRKNAFSKKLTILDLSDILILPWTEKDNRFSCSFKSVSRTFWQLENGTWQIHWQDGHQDGQPKITPMMLPSTKTKDDVQATLLRWHITHIASPRDSERGSDVMRHKIGLLREYRLGAFAQKCSMLFSRPVGVESSILDLATKFELV